MNGISNNACLVILKMPATLRNTTITEKYFDFVKEKYAKPKQEEILCSYVNERETKKGNKSATGKEIGTARYPFKCSRKRK